MNTPESANSQAKPGWDKRAWKLALAFFVAIAALTVGGFALNATSFEYVDASLMMLAMSVALSLFVCPAILAGVARRLWPVWAYMPWLALIVSLRIGSSIKPVLDGPTLSLSPGTTFFMGTTSMERGAFWLIAAFMLGPLVSARPVCLFRVFRRRARTTELKRQAAIDEAIHSHREGSWPPPVDRGSAQ